jgi:hypothetical protein
MRIKQLAHDLPRTRCSETISTSAIADAIVREVNALIRALSRSKR